jgi:hypothetical protein
MRTLGRYDGDEWTNEGPNITSADKLGAVEAALSRDAIIVEHRVYRGGRAPDRLIFTSFEAFTRWLHEKTFAGDSIWVWDYGALCRDDNAVASGKCSDERGQVPLKGAY